jgi:hypothetical protein
MGPENGVATTLSTKWTGSLSALPWEVLVNEQTGKRDDEWKTANLNLAYKPSMCIFYDNMSHHSTDEEPKIPSYRFYMDSKKYNKEIAFIIIFFNSKLSRKLDIQHYRTDVLQTFD